MACPLSVTSSFLVSSSSPGEKNLSKRKTGEWIFFPSVLNWKNPLTKRFSRVTTFLAGTNLSPPFAPSQTIVEKAAS